MGISTNKELSYTNMNEVGNKLSFVDKVKLRLDQLNNYKDEYVIHSYSRNNEVSIILKHTPCGELITITYQCLMQLNKIHCNKCKIKNNTKLFKEKLKLKYDNYEDFEVLGDYINVRTFIKMQHLKCGHIYDMQPKSMLDMGLRCPICCNNSKKTTTKYKNDVFNLTKGEFLVLGEYVNWKTKILTKRVKCKHVFHAIPSKFLKKPYCPVCLKKKNTFEKNKKFVYSFNKKFKGEYEILTQIYNRSGVVDLLHTKCGCLFTTTYSDAMKNNIKPICPKCKKNYNKKELNVRK